MGAGASRGFSMEFGTGVAGKLKTEETLRSVELSGAEAASVSVGSVFSEAESGCSIAGAGSSLLICS
jgi:hypothetical protein